MLPVNLTQAIKTNGGPAVNENFFTIKKCGNNCTLVFCF